MTCPLTAMHQALQHPSSQRYQARHGHQHHAPHGHPSSQLHQKKCCTTPAVWVQFWRSRSHSRPVRLTAPLNLPPAVARGAHTQKGLLHLRNQPRVIVNDNFRKLQGASFGISISTSASSTSASTSTCISVSVNVDRQIAR